MSSNLETENGFAPSGDTQITSRPPDAVRRSFFYTPA